ncbi:hypothetical protein K7432_018373 [Basidiobolus ranarum]|uniref:Uncharacterized protein n=1 Tax=Basidiobolus ranarum TaxID=34480 RepID=A0ABR2WC95_9FUNG
MKYTSVVAFVAILSATTALPAYYATKPSSSKYCTGLVDKLNTLGASLDVAVCIGKPEKYGYVATDLDKMSCQDLVTAVTALGIKVDAGICTKGDKKSSDYGNGADQPGKKGNTDPKASSYSDKSSTSSNQPGKGSNPGDKGSSMGDQTPDGGENSNKYTAPAKGSSPNSYESPNKHGDSGVTPDGDNKGSKDKDSYKITTSGGDTGGSGKSSSNTGDYTKGSKLAFQPSCNDTCNSLSLLGVKVDVSICLSEKNAGLTAPVLSVNLGCPTLIANAKLLGIAHVDVSLCH